MVHLLDLPVPHSGASRQVGLVPIEPCLVRPILIASPFHDVIIWSGYTLPSVGTRELRWSACLRADPPAGPRAGAHRQAGVAQQEHSPAGKPSETRETGGTGEG
jgi:hypothetical protein